jgi:transcriptional regulator with XRE-family HTH domain
MLFGERVRELRLRKQLSQPQVADLVGIDATYLSKIENGKVSPPAGQVIRRLARSLDYDEEELLLLGDKFPSTYLDRIRKDPLVADFFRTSPEFTRSQRQRIRQIIDESERG